MDGLDMTRTCSVGPGMDAISVDGVTMCGLYMYGLGMDGLCMDGLVMDGVYATIGNIPTISQIRMDG